MIQGNVSTAKKRMLPVPPFSPVLKKVSMGSNNSPIVAIVGSKDISSRVEESLVGSKFDTIVCSTIDELFSIKKHSRDFHTVVLAYPCFDMKEKVERIRSEGLDVPIHVVTLIPCTDEFARVLYTQGASAVIDFSKDSKIYPYLLSKIKKMGPKITSARPVGSRVRRVILARIFARFGVIKHLKIWMKDGVAFLSGSVASLAKKERVEKIIEETSGVEGVVFDALQLPKSEKVDQELTDRVGSVIEGVSGGMKDTVAFEVKKQKLVLMGNVGSEKKYRTLIKKLKSLFGIQKIKNFVSISDAQTQLDRVLARKLKRNLKCFVQGSMVRVAVTKNVAILTGWVKDYKSKGLIETVVTQYGDIKSVVNKIQVA